MVYFCNQTGPQIVLESIRVHKNLSETGDVLIYIIIIDFTVNNNKLMSTNNRSFKIL